MATLGRSMRKGNEGVSVSDWRCSANGGMQTTHPSGMTLQWAESELAISFSVLRHVHLGFPEQLSAAPSFGASSLRYAFDFGPPIDNVTVAHGSIIRSKLGYGSAYIMKQKYEEEGTTGWWCNLHCQDVRMREIVIMECAYRHRANPWCQAILAHELAAPLEAVAEFADEFTCGELGEGLACGELVDVVTGLIRLFSMVDRALELVLVIVYANRRVGSDGDGRTYKAGIVSAGCGEGGERECDGENSG
ncbi:hypothetical protein DFP72DRAFT_1142648 [Ephemerocybe angulata]|uniref:Uncharacterized protein n=1 Tax=Ephemerocybe angulata TaxID=980116 RepID=A0A8H6HNJ2_9AGAR|nr:hypothetical protein DFP72DRAFT_1142648 [Tulosesus angulatus]